MPPRHLALAFSVAMVWGVNFVMIDLGLGSFPPLRFAALRFALIAFPAVLFLPRPPVALRWLFGVGMFMCAGQFGLLFTAMHDGLPAGLASVVLQLQAVFTIGFAVLLLDEKQRPLQLVGCGLALAGLAATGAGGTRDVPITPLLVCVGAAASWGLGNTCCRRANAPDALALLAWSSLVAAVPLLALSLVLEGPSRGLTALAGLHPAGILALLYVVIVSTAFGFGAWTWLLQRHPASSVAPIALLVPPVGVLTAWIARGERPGVVELVGMLIVLAGLVLVNASHLFDHNPSSENRRRQDAMVTNAVVAAPVTQQFLAPSGEAR